MRIGINAYEANVENRVGSNVYAYRILCELEKLAVHDEVLVYLPTPPLPDLPKERPGWTYRVIPPAKLWTHWRLPLAVWGDHLHSPLSVFYSLGHYAPRFPPCPSVVSIMDLAFVRYPQLFRSEDTYKLSSWTKYSVNQAAGVVAISEATKQDVLSVYGVSEKNVIVAYPGKETIPNSDSASEKKELAALGITEPYVVYVGTLQPRKNLVRVIHAFEHVHNRHPELYLVLAGKIGWMAESTLLAIEKSPAKSHIRQLGFVNDAQKWALLRHARASLLLGLYEGFGIPALESMQAGTPPIVANTASLPEVVGPHGWQANPHNVLEIAEAVEKAIQLNEMERKEWMQRVREWIKRFDWTESGKSVWGFLLQIGRREV